MHMLDLSKKRVRNPITHSGDGPGMSSQDADSTIGGGNHDDEPDGMGMRTSYAPKTEQDYEAGMDGEGEDVDEDEDEDEELPEDDDGEDEDYRDD